MAYALRDSMAPRRFDIAATQRGCALDWSLSSEVMELNTSTMAIAPGVAQRHPLWSRSGACAPTTVPTLDLRYCGRKLHVPNAGVHARLWWCTWRQLSQLSSLPEETPRQEESLQTLSQKAPATGFPMKFGFLPDVQGALPASSGTKPWTIHDSFAKTRLHRTATIG
jgi:hypothetical protein